MKKIGAYIVVALIGVMLAVCLAGCGGSSSSGSAPNGSASTSADESSASVADEPANEPVYVMTKHVAYAPDGTEMMVNEYAFDEQGRATSWHMASAGNGSGGGMERTWEYSDYTPEGYYQKMTSSDGIESVLKYTIENGRAMKLEQDNGQVTEYERYDSGSIKSMTTLSEQSTVVAEYDENGYQISSTYTPKQSSGGVETKFAYEWSFDEAGKPVSCVKVDADAKQELAIECDDAGNIVKVTNSEGAVQEEFEYAKIENPCDARLYNETKVIM